MTIIFPDKWQTASQSTPGPSLAGFAPNRPGGNSGQKRPGHGRSCLVLPKPTSLESQNPEKGRGPSRSHSSLPSKPRALALQQAHPASEGFPGSLGESLPPTLRSAKLPVRGVWRIWLGQPWQESLVLGREWLFVGSSPPPGAKQSGVGVVMKGD